MEKPVPEKPVPDITVKPSKAGYKAYKWMKIPGEAPFRIGTESSYDAQIIWSVGIEGRQFELVLNSQATRFALKHVLFAKPELDKRKFLQKHKQDLQKYIDTKLDERLAKRNTAPLGDINKIDSLETFRQFRLTDKFRINGQPITNLCVINLKFPDVTGFPHRKIEEAVARECIARALAAHTFTLGTGKKTNDMELIAVDFKVPCVITRTGGGKTSVASVMNIGVIPQYGYSNEKGGCCVLVHGET